MPSVGWCLVWALSGRLCSSLTSFAVVELSRSSLTSCAVEKRFCEGRNPVALSLSCRVIANGFAAPEGSPRGTAGFRPPAGGRVTSLLRAQKRSNQEKRAPPVRRPTDILSTLRTCRPNLTTAQGPPRAARVLLALLEKAKATATATVRNEDCVASSSDLARETVA